MKKKRKLNLRKSKVANMNTLDSIKGGMTLGCTTDGCDLSVGCTIMPHCTSLEGHTTCPTTYTTSPDTETCPGGTMSESGTGGGETNNNCSANLPSLNC